MKSYTKAVNIIDIHKLLDLLNEQHVHVHVYTYMYTCIYMYMCIYIHVYMYTICTDLVCDGGLALEGVAHILSVGSDL